MASGSHREDDAQTVVDAPSPGALPEVDYRIAVAVSNPENIDQLMRTALDIARDNEGEVLVVSVISKSNDSPFAVFTDEVIKREFAGDRREILDRALSMADERGVRVRGRLLVSHDISQAIERAVDEYDCDAVLLGWHERRRTESVFGRNVDRVVTRAPCDVLVEKIGPTANGVEAVLVPANEGENTELAAAVARAIAVSNDARVDILRVVAPDATDAERADAEALVERVAEHVSPAVDIETVVVEGEDVSETLTEATASRDVTVLGATERGWFRRLVVGPTPERVGRDAQSTVVVTKRASALSRLERWLRTAT